MKCGIITPAVFIIWITFFSSDVSSQTLTETLIADDPVKLAEEARAVGNIVRGAILFHQGNINCAKCHRPSAEKDRIGPDLSRIEPDATDQYLIESILQPSKVIKKGFETTLLVDIDGRVYNGVVIQDDAEKIVIRDSQNIELPVTILRGDIEEMKPGSISSMPDNLVNELGDRQDFLDLLRYVIDVRERGPEPEVAVGASLNRRELDPDLKGLALIQELNCVACHSTEKFPAMVRPKQAPRLRWSAMATHPEWLESFIRDPHGIRPGTTMPELLAGMEGSKREKLATAITHFLLSRADKIPEFVAADETAVSRGAELFNSVGCVACHSPRNQKAEEILLDDSVPLGDLSAKYTRGGLVELLENPLVARPSGHMPNMRLAHREAIDIANFLLQSAGERAGSWNIDEQLAGEGELLFLRNNCHACHTDVIAETAEPARELSLEGLDPLKGCLADETGMAPNFHLLPGERQSIRAALDRISVDLTSQQQIDVSLHAFNCLACHERNNLGGVTPDRNPHFQTTNLNLGDQGRIPPGLTGAGAKLKPKWMREVLVTGRSIRPYMKTRMPQFGEENIGYLVDLFQSSDHLPATSFAEFDNQEAMRKKGLELAGNNGLNCVSCHTYQYKSSETMPAVDLTEMTERLEKDWFYQYMMAPQSFSRNTVMPSFWPGGKAVRKDIEGTPEEQIEALWQYLIDGRQAAMPHGVVREPLEIVVEDEARMLRRSYPGIGKRGIGVGYPGEVNLAFDAEQLRLHAIWRGKFADPGGVWNGQGSGNVRPMGKTLEFASGPELDDIRQPWVVDEGRPPGHQFRGYELDKKRRPTFRYSFDKVSVEDFFTELVDDGSGKTGLRRHIAISSPEARSGLRFRIASASEILVDDRDSFLLDNKLRIRIPSGTMPEIVLDGVEVKRLEFRFDLAPEKEHCLDIEYWWE